MPATIDALSGFQHIRLIDISRDGACLSGSNLPAAGKDVVLRCGNVDAFGVVIWRTPDRCGVLFDEPVGTKDLVALRKVAIADELAGISHEERQAAADWLSGFAR